MNVLKILFIIFISIYSIVMLIFLMRTKKPFKNLLINAIIGIGILAVLYLTRKFTGISIPINAYTATFSAVGGIAGVLLILILKLIFIV